MYHILTNIPKFFKPGVNENFMRIFKNYINDYQGHNKEIV